MATQEKTPSAKIIRNALAESIRASLKLGDGFTFDTESKKTQRYSYYIGVKFAGKSKTLCEIYPHGDRVDVCLSKKLADAFVADTQPTQTFKPAVSSSGSDVALGITNETGEGLVNDTVALLESLMTYAAKAAEPKKEEPKPEKEKPAPKAKKPTPKAKK